MTEPGTLAFGPFRIYQVRSPRGRRIRQLLIGLPFFGIALGLAVEANLGVNPWTVFHGGLANHTPLTIGTATIVVGALLLLAFPLLREPFGLGTLLNVAIIGLITDATIAVVPDLTSMWTRVAALGVAPVLIGLGSGLYIGAGLGPGPRDGLMTALERRGLPIWLARTVIEATALAVGWVLGGDVGLGTVWIAGSVGFFVDFFLRRLRVRQPEVLQPRTAR